MNLLRGPLSKVVASRVRPLEASWWPPEVGAVLVVGSCSPEFASALMDEARRRGGEVRVDVLAQAHERARFGERAEFVVARGLWGSLGALRAIRRGCFGLCLIPLTGEGGRGLKMLGVLSGAKHVVLCPEPDKWHLLARPRLSARALFAPVVAVASKAVALVSITARCSWILMGRRLRLTRRGPAGSGPDPSAGA